eukprot:gene2043-1232_t
MKRHQSCLALCGAVTLVALLAILPLETPQASAFSFQFGGGGRQEAPPKRPSRPYVDYYAALDLDAGEASQITERQIKQQYRLLSRRYHPDAGSSDLPEAETRERYTRIQQAYEVLSDKEKRKMFDLLGEKGLELLQQRQQMLKQGGGAGNMFGGMFPMGDPLKAADMDTTMEVDLLDIFTGKVKPLHFRKKCICSSCKGTGAPLHSAKKRCQQCRGSGVVVSHIQLAPGMVQQMQQPCPRCNGEGEEYAEVCRLCHGQRHQYRTVALAVDVPKGAPDGHVVTFEMEGEEATDRIPGNLRVRLTARPHPRFSRVAGSPSDLETVLKITLKEALLGFEKTLVHLDGVERVVVRREPGTLTPYSTTIKIAGKGLPHMDRNTRGDLYVQLVFELPKTLTVEQKKAIDKVF